MTTTQTIVREVQSLPEATQREVLDFIEFLRSRQKERIVREDGVPWSRFSLASAMRDMEDEATPYTAADLRETFL